MEIFVDQELTRTEFLAELDTVGYQRQEKPLTVGGYFYDKNSVEFIKRPFAFWGGKETDKRLRVKFKGGRLSEIRDISDRASLGIIRLEPQLIGKIYPHHNEDRVLVPFAYVPSFLINALLAIEDRHFFSHAGLDLRGILRALITNLRHGGISHGGSTLTQQLVKNFFLSNERTYWRKFNEMIMSVLLERRYTKADILSAYINEVYLGQQGARAIHGFGTAAEYYFARPLQELRHDQLALLVGLVKGASYYNPYRHPERSLTRRNLVLQVMGKLGIDDAKKLQKAKSEKLDLADKPSWSRAKYPAFLDLVRRQLLRDYRLEDLRNEGLHIFTTLDPRLQDKIEQAVTRQLTLLENRNKQASGNLQVAAVVMHVGSGEVVGLLGGREREKISFNRAIDATRPIGSLIKPVIYYAALSKPSAFNVMSILDDSPVYLQQDDGSVWQPKNYDRKSHENVTLLEALSHSYNQATVRLGLELGLDQIIDILRRLGIKKEISKFPSLLLGAIEMTPLDVAQIYQSFANGGFKISNNTIREVLYSNGTALSRYPLQMEQVLENAPVFLSNYLMTEVVSRGTGKSLAQLMPQSMPLAGKTGTTNDLRDSWFAGFGDEFVAVVWLGRDDNKSTHFTGAGGAMRIWAEMMTQLDMEKLNLITPEEIDWSSGSDEFCQQELRFPYIQGFKPAELICE